MSAATGSKDRRVPWRIAMDEALSDNAWHPIGEILMVGFELIPNELGLAKMDLRTSNGYVGDQALRTLKGRYHIAKDVLQRALVTTAWEKNGDFVRLRQTPWPKRKHKIHYPRTPWGQAMYDALADGEWYSIRDVIAIGAEIVPPVRALAEVGTNRRSRSKKTGVVFHDPGAPEAREQSIRSGQWQVARKTLLDQTTRNLFYERKGEMVRRIEWRESP